MLEAAARLFGERGVGRTSVREVGRAAGVTLATVHHYFGTKAELHRACVDAMYAELRRLEGELEPVFADALGAGPASDRGATIDRVVVTAFRFARRHRAANRLVVREVLEAGGELPEPIRQGYLLPFLERGSQLLAQLTPLPAEEARLVLQSITYVIARYALNSDRELARVAGHGDASTEATLGRVERHLVRLARALLGLAPPEAIS